MSIVNLEILILLHTVFGLQFLRKYVILDAASQLISIVRDEHIAKLITQYFNSHTPCKNYPCF